MLCSSKTSIRESLLHALLHFKVHFCPGHSQLYLEPPPFVSPRFSSLVILLVTSMQGLSYPPRLGPQRYKHYQVRDSTCNYVCIARPLGSLALCILAGVKTNIQYVKHCDK